MNDVIEDPIPWTTARCTRLLRPIESRLALLRKNIHVARTELQENTTGTHIRTYSKNAKTSGGERDANPESSEPEFENRKGTDPEWLPIPRTKQSNVLRKYTAKGTRPQLSTSKFQNAQRKPGEIALPTPVIARTIKSLDESPQLECSPLVNEHLKKRRRRHGFYPQGLHLQGLKKTMSADEFKHISGLSDALANVLKATSAAKPSSRATGPKSLFSTCLRRVPTYINVEQQWLQANNKDDDQIESVSYDIYSELESTNSSAGNGWGPLREILRAHAIQSLCSAMLEGVFSTKSIDAFTELCIQQRAWDAARRFLECWSSLQNSISEPNTLDDDMFDREQRPFYAKLLDYARQTQSWNFFLSELTNLIQRRKLSVNWLGTEYAFMIWSRVISALSNSSSRISSESSAFLEAVVLQGLERRDQSLTFSTQHGEKDSSPQIRSAFSNALASVAAMLTSMSLASLHEDDCERPGRIQFSVAWNMQNISQSLIRSSSFGPSNAISETKRKMVFLTSSLLLSRCGIELNPSYSSVTLEALVGLMNSAPSQTKAAREQMNSLVIEVARCFDRIQGKNDFAHFNRLVRALLPAESPLAVAYLHQSEAETSNGTSIYGIDDNVSVFLHQFAYEAALHCAIKSEDESQFQFASAIKQGLSNLNPIDSEADDEDQKCTDSSDFASKPPSGYRWEEGLSEWVACTPGPALRKDTRRVNEPENSPVTPMSIPQAQPRESALISSALSLRPSTAPTSLAQDTSPLKSDFEDDDSHPTLSSMLMALESSPIMEFRNGGRYAPSVHCLSDDDSEGQNNILAEASPFSLNAGLKRHIESTDETDDFCSNKRPVKKGKIAALSTARQPVQSSKATQREKRLALRRVLSERVAREIQRKPSQAHHLKPRSEIICRNGCKDDLGSKENVESDSARSDSLDEDSEVEDELSSFDESLTVNFQKQAVKVRRLGSRSSASSLRKQAWASIESEDELGVI